MPLWESSNNTATENSKFKVDDGDDSNYVVEDNPVARMLEISRMPLTIMEVRKWKNLEGVWRIGGNNEQRRSESRYDAKYTWKEAAKFDPKDSLVLIMSSILHLVKSGFPKKIIINDMDRIFLYLET